VPVPSNGEVAEVALVGRTGVAEPGLAAEIGPVAEMPETSPVCVPDTGAVELPADNGAGDGIPETGAVPVGATPGTPVGPG
jgi:hypothetical protein